VRGAGLPYTTRPRADRWRGCEIAMLPARPSTVAEIRQAFLDYFAGHGHAVVPSHSLLPPADPTLLFVNAGMVQFKDYFTGARPAPHPTACSTQKCLRVSGKHNDLENVGRTRRHHTLFEMLGNFSFGDYFKEGAIRHAWTFLVDHLGLDRDRLVVTYFAGNASVPADTEARDLWARIAGLPADRIVPLGEKDNFWAMGDTGPCGPCSEIYWDLDPGQGPACTLAADDGRYIEIWNCVFMQYDRQAGALSPLPAPCVDTGMGLERVSAVVAGAPSNYGTDLFLDLIAAMELASGETYTGRFDAEGVVSADPEIERDVAMRVIADHARATAFLVAEGIYPDSEGRGYVLRRIMRRAIRYGRKIGVMRPFFAHVAVRVADLLGAVFPELSARKDVIAKVVLQEEERFAQTLEAGLRLIASEIADMGAGPRVLSGDAVFLLHDTHGFPDDLTALICAEQGVAIDHAGFAARMADQRARGKASWKKDQGDLQALARSLAGEGPATEFVGHACDACDAIVRALIDDEATGARWAVFDATPCYAEGGGQVGDRARVIGPRGQASISDTQRYGTSVHLHRLADQEGDLAVGDRVQVAVLARHRQGVRAHHSATHLVHKALRDVLGGHVKQRGSLVTADRLRFDFAHYAALTAAEIRAVEDQVNDAVLANAAAAAVLTTMDAALAAGAMAFFGDKYGDVVRMVSLGDAVELCGGTHVARTGDIGVVKIVAEAAVSAGVRRIEAVCHREALALFQASQDRLAEIAARLGGQPGQVLERIDRLHAQLRTAEQEAGKWQQRALSGESGPSADERDLGGLRAVFQVVDGADAASLRTLADQVRDRIGSGIVALLGVQGDGKALLVVAATKDAALRVPAGPVVAALAGLLGGRGGGRPDFAQAGGALPADLAAFKDAYFAAVLARTTAAG